MIQIIQTLRWEILRHQYGIFVAESQTFLLTKRPQRRRAKEKRMLSQARSSSDHLRLEEPNFNMKTYGQQAFSVAAPRLWNKLPFEIRACSDVNLFKSKLKTFLFKKVYDI